MVAASIVTFRLLSGKEQRPSLFFYIVILDEVLCFKIHSLFLNLLRVVNVFLIIIYRLLHADVQLRGSLDIRCAAALQTRTTPIDSELLGYCEIQ